MSNGFEKVTVENSDEMTKKDIMFKTGLTETTFQAIIYASSTLNLIIWAGLV